MKNTLIACRVKGERILCITKQADKWFWRLQEAAIELAYAFSMALCFALTMYFIMEGL